jgi:hypothetical protein
MMRRSVFTAGAVCESGLSQIPHGRNMTGVSHLFLSGISGHRLSFANVKD